MTKWTSEAEQRLFEYLEQVQDLAPKEEGDVEELCKDLETHIRREAEEEGEAPVTLSLLEQVLQKVGTPEDILGVDRLGEQKSGTASAVLEAGFSQASKEKLDTSFSLSIFLGVLIPLLAIVVEALTGITGAFGINPIPSYFHLIQLLLVVVAMVYIIKRCDNRSGHKLSAKHAGRLYSSLGYILGVSLLYSLLLLLISPISAVSIFLFGAGLMGFAPMFTLLISWRCLRRVWPKLEFFNLSVQQRRRYVLIPFFTMIIVNFAYLGLVVFREHAIEMTCSTDFSQQSAGLKHLHRIGAEKVILRRAYTGKKHSLMLDELMQKIWPALTISGEKLDERTNPKYYQKLYYQLTGQVFSSVPRPSATNTRGALLGGLFEQRTDPDQGGSVVGNVWNQDLRLSASLLDASIAARYRGTSGSAVGYMEWTLEYTNHLNFPREARSEIILPSGGVVSRLTLWINGVESEAAFGGRSQVRAAYQEVAVVRQRDPALVTSIGPDRVMLQCFPVPAKGTMKVKLGISAPLLIRDEEACMRLPYIGEKNFAYDKKLQHSIWIESTGPFARHADTLHPESTPEKAYALRGMIGPEGLSQAAQGTFSIAYPKLSRAMHFTGEVNGYIGSMELAPHSEARPPKKLLVVVDGSANMSKAQVDWNALFNSASPDCSIEVFVSGFELGHWESEKEGRDSLLSLLEGYDYYGGTNPVPALLAALEALATDPDSILLFLHGPYPFEGSNLSQLEQHLKRRPIQEQDGVPRFFSLQVVDGPNTLRKQLVAVQGYRVAPILFSNQDSLNYLVKNGGVEDVRRVYVSLSNEGEVASNEHVARLAAAERIRRLVASGLKEDFEKARDLGVKTRLVTAASGAVVLEREEQYRRHNLDPKANQEAIPGIPEPEEWALLILCLLAAFALILWKYKQDRAIAA